MCWVRRRAAGRVEAGGALAEAQTPRPAQQRICANQHTILFGSALKLQKREAVCASARAPPASIRPAARLRTQHTALLGSALKLHK